MITRNAHHYHVSQLFLLYSNTLTSVKHVETTRTILKRNAITEGLTRRHCYLHPPV